MSMRRVDDIRGIPDLGGVSVFQAIWVAGLVAGATLMWGRELSDSQYIVFELLAGLAIVLTAWWLLTRTLRLVARAAQWALRASLREIRHAWKEAGHDN